VYPVADSPGTTEADKVEGWRLHVLLEARYPITIAEQLAAETRVDLHQAVELLRQGCTAELAAEILL
jgi:hypothetical protein